MATGRVERRLAAILAADVAGHSRLMGADEEGTLAWLKAIRREVADPKIRSLALNPSCAQGWFSSGWLRLYAGQTGLAIKHFATSARLNPGSEASTLNGIGQAHFFDRKFDDALEKLLMARHAIPIHATTDRFLASCYAHMGRLDDAREMVERLRTITSVVVPNAVQYRNPEHRDLFLSGLRLAAGENT